MAFVQEWLLLRDVMYFATAGKKDVINLLYPMKEEANNSYA